MYSGNDMKNIEVIELFVPASRRVRLNLIFLEIVGILC